jgi:hypothetical protein
VQERIEYIETTYGLPTDATERESRAFSQAIFFFWVFEGVKFFVLVFFFFNF